MTTIQPVATKTPRIMPATVEQVAAIATSPHLQALFATRIPDTTDHTPLSTEPAASEKMKPLVQVDARTQPSIDAT